MGKISINKNGILSMDSVDGEEDLHRKARVFLNPPPEDGKCQCCGKHISQLKPFGKAGKSKKKGYFDDALLIKNFRSEGPYNEEAEATMEEANKQAPEDPRGWLMAKYGNEKGESLYSIAEAHSWVVKSWECRDCIGLNEDEYFERKLKSSK